LISPDRIKEIANNKLLEDNVNWGVIDISIGADKKDRVSFQIIGSQTKVQPMLKPKEKKFIFSVKLTIEGDVVEVGQDMFKAFDANFVKNVEKQAENEVENLCLGVFEKLQKSFKADALGLCEVVANHYPTFWDKHKHEWKEYFLRSELKLNVDVSVRRIGLIK